MIALIWMLTWLPQVLPAVSELPRPVNVNLLSHHFNHTLRWEPGPGTPTGVYYQVTMNTETGASWAPVSGCEHVQHPLVCNLTEAFSNRNQAYFAKVTVLLDGWAPQEALYEGFQPMKDTHLDLPLLTVTTCGRNLCVDLQPPVEQLRDIYETLNYKLRVTFNGVSREQDTMSLERQILKDLAPNRRYCVSIRISDSMVQRTSNYSGPVCAVTFGNYAADPVISATLCVLVLFGLVFVVLLVSTGYICLTGRPLPQVLTSIHHLEDVVVVAPRSVSLSSLLNLKPTPPSSGKKRSSQISSEDSDGESVTESPGGSGGGGYKLRVGTNLLSSTSSSSLSAPLSTASFSSKEASYLGKPQPVARTSTETHSGAELNDALSTHTDSHSDPPTESDQCASDPPADGLTGGRIQPNEEEEVQVEVVVVGEEDSQDVNLLTLTFGRQEEAEEEEEEESHVESSSMLEVCNTTVNLPVREWDSEEAAGETVSCSIEEEEEEEDTGYIGRPCTHVLQNLI